MTGGALAGVRVLDLTRLLPGGLCTVLLADLGADVLKIEAPGGGDPARARGPHYESSDPSVSSASFVGLNRNKRSLVLDLKAPGDRERLLALTEDADVLVDSFRPGVLDRLGLSFDDVLHRRSPRLVHCTISGWGGAGPRARAAGHDVNYLATMGLLSLTGTPDEEPSIPPMQVADGAGALFAATAILAALRERDASGCGQSIDVSLAHSALALMSMRVAAVLAGDAPVARGDALFSGGVACYQAYRCADGWIALGALELRFWRALCDGLGRPDLVEHRYAATGSPPHAELVAIFAGRTRDEWAAFGAEHDCCLTPVVGLADALRSDDVTARGAVVAIDQPEIAGPVRVFGSPIAMSRTPPDPHRLPAPPLGADVPHTRTGGSPGSHGPVDLTS